MEKSETIQRSQMIRNIRERLKSEYDITLTNDQIGAVIKIEEDEIYTIIAEGDSFKYSWGRIGGKERLPMKLGGAAAFEKTVLENGGYSMWKKGVPFVRWSKAAALADVYSPEEYFNCPENRYTTKARIFRKDAGLPEIPEFEGLSEEKILEINGKADAKKIANTSKGLVYKQRKRDRDAQSMFRARRALWEKEGHVPYGAIDNWGGVQRDKVDLMMEIAQRNASLVRRLDLIRDAKDFAEFTEVLDKHPEVLEEEEKLLKQLEELDITPQPHVNKAGYKLCNDGFCGVSDPWGVKNVTVKEIFEKRREELKENGMGAEEKKELEEIQKELFGVVKNIQ